MALLKAGPVASIHVFTAQVFHYSNITCPFIHPQQPLLKGTFSVEVSARDWCLKILKQWGKLPFFLFLPFFPRKKQNSQVYLMGSLLSQTMTVHAERMEGETCNQYFQLK